jgi:hypothetical protein
LREEHRLGVFESGVLKKIYGPKRIDVSGELRRLHNEELNDLYSSLNIIRVIKSRRMRWVRHVAYVGDHRGAYMVLVRIAEGRQPFGRPRRRWEDTSKMDPEEMGWEAWTGLIWLKIEIGSMRL